MTAALARASFSSSSAMVGLKGSNLLMRDRAAGVCADYREMNSAHGHDAFLAEQADLVKLLQ